MGADSNQAQVKCLLLPLEDDVVVLPNSLVAEIVAYQKVQSAVDGPDWLIGRVEWRGHDLPLLSFEVACGQPLEPLGRKVQFVVMNVLNIGVGLNFYALRIHGIPRFEFIDRSKIAAAVQQTRQSELVATRVFINGVSAFIPNIDRFESLLTRIAS